MHSTTITTIAVITTATTIITYVVHCIDSSKYFASTCMLWVGDCLAIEIFFKSNSILEDLELYRNECCTKVLFINVILDEE